MPGRPPPAPPPPPRLARCRTPCRPAATGWRTPGLDVWLARAGASTIRSYLAGCLQPGAWLYNGNPQSVARGGAGVGSYGADVSCEAAGAGREADVSCGAGVGCTVDVGCGAGVSREVHVSCG